MEAKKQTMIRLDDGRLGIVRQLSNNGFGFNIGCGWYHFENKINLDIDPTKSNSEIIGSVMSLPLKKDIAEEIIFTDVLEHVPKGMETKALKEMCFVLKPEGRLLLSVPNNRFMLKVLDPYYWLTGHRHYTRKQIEGFLEGTHLEPIKFLCSGRVPWGIVTLTYAANFLLRRKKLDLFAKLSTNAFDGAYGGKAFTMYAILKKTRAVRKNVLPYLERIRREYGTGEAYMVYAKWLLDDRIKAKYPNGKLITATNRYNIGTLTYKHIRDLVTLEKVIHLSLSELERIAREKGCTVLDRGYYDTPPWFLFGKARKPFPISTGFFKFLHPLERLGNPIMSHHVYVVIKFPLTNQPKGR